MVDGKMIGAAMRSLAAKVAAPDALDNPAFMLGFTEAAMADMVQVLREMAKRGAAGAKRVLRTYGLEE